MFITKLFQVLTFLDTNKKFWSILVLLITSNISTLAVASSANSFEEKIKKHQFKIEVSGENMEEASTLLISCVDFRLRDETAKLMTEELGLLNDYDEITFPGASLALVQNSHPQWRETIEDIVDILKKLHNIKRIILLDHRDCGAYKLIKGHDYGKTPELETEVHHKILLEAKKLLQQKFPDLKIYTMLLGLDGTVENIHE